MSIDTKNNAPNSAAARRMPRSNKASETDHVAREAAEAKSALLASIANLKTSTANSLDVRRWARRYPLRTAGAAMLAGFAAAAWVRGKRSPPEEGTNDKPRDDASQGAEADQTSSASQSSSRSAFTALIITALLDVLKTAAQSFLMNAIRPPQDTATPDADQFVDDAN